jgi:hypothetical protein
MTDLIDRRFLYFEKLFVALKELLICFELNYIVNVRFSIYYKIIF